MGEHLAIAVPDLQIAIAHPSWPWQDEALSLARRRPPRPDRGRRRPPGAELLLPVFGDQRRGPGGELRPIDALLDHRLAPGRARGSAAAKSMAANIGLMNSPVPDPSAWWMWVGAGTMGQRHAGPGSVGDRAVAGPQAVDDHVARRSLTEVQRVDDRPEAGTLRHLTRPAMDDTDRALIALLRHDARASIATLASKLGVSRGTVTNRLRKLEDEQLIVGYSVVLRPDAEPQRIRAWMGVRIDGNQSRVVTASLLGEPGVEALHDTNGRWDLMAEIRARDMTELSQVLERIRLIKGIAHTETSILLATFR